MRINQLDKNKKFAVGFAFRQHANQSNDRSNTEVIANSPPQKKLICFFCDGVLFHDGFKTQTSSFANEGDVITFFIDFVCSSFFLQVNDIFVSLNSYSINSINSNKKIKQSCFPVVFLYNKHDSAEFLLENKFFCKIQN